MTNQRNQPRKPPDRVTFAGPFGSASVATDDALLGVDHSSVGRRLGLVGWLVGLVGLIGDGWLVGWWVGSVGRLVDVGWVGWVGLVGGKVWEDDDFFSCFFFFFAFFCFFRGMGGGEMFLFVCLLLKS